MRYYTGPVHDFETGLVFLNSATAAAYLGVSKATIHQGLSERYDALWNEHPYQFSRFYNRDAGWHEVIYPPARKRYLGPVRNLYKDEVYLNSTIAAYSTHQSSMKIARLCDEGEALERFEMVGDDRGFTSIPVSIIEPNDKDHIPSLSLNPFIPRGKEDLVKGHRRIFASMEAFKKFAVDEGNPRPLYTTQRNRRMVVFDPASHIRPIEWVDRHVRYYDLDLVRELFGLSEFVIRNSIEANSETYNGLRFAEPEPDAVYSDGSVGYYVDMYPIQHVVRED